MKVLVTGFEPFAGASLNPSGEIVKRLSGENLVTAVLPVTYEGAAAELLRLVREHQPSAVVCLGQAEGRSTISFERVAINLDDASLADNAGVTRVDQPIDPSGPDAYFTTLPVRELADAVKAAGVPASLSLSAGTFVCNHIFYELQNTLAGTGVRSGFVHVPLMDEQAEAEKAVGDVAANKAKMEELQGKIAALRNEVPGFYTRALEIDANYYDALYQLGALYFNEGAEIKRLVNAMDMATYQKEGKAYEAKLAAKYQEAVPFFERALKVKKDEDLKEILKTLKELKQTLKKHQLNLNLSF